MELAEGHRRAVHDDANSAKQHGARQPKPLNENRHRELPAVVRRDRHDSVPQPGRAGLVPAADVRVGSAHRVVQQALRNAAGEDREHLSAGFPRRGEDADRQVPQFPLAGDAPRDPVRRRDRQVGGAGLRLHRPCDFAREGGAAIAVGGRVPAWPLGPCRVGPRPESAGPAGSTGVRRVLRPLQLLLALREAENGFVINCATNLVRVGK